MLSVCSVCCKQYFGFAIFLFHRDKKLMKWNRLTPRLPALCIKPTHDSLSIILSSTAPDLIRLPTPEAGHSSYTTVKILIWLRDVPVAIDMQMWQTFIQHSEERRLSVDLIPHIKKKSNESASASRSDPERVQNEEQTPAGIHNLIHSSSTSVLVPKLISEIIMRQLEPDFMVAWSLWPLILVRYDSFERGPNYYLVTRVKIKWYEPKRYSTYCSLNYELICSDVASVTRWGHTMMVRLTLTSPPWWQVD